MELSKTYLYNHVLLECALSSTKNSDSDHTFVTCNNVFKKRPFLLQPAHLDLKNIITGAELGRMPYRDFLQIRSQAINWATRCPKTRHVARDMIDFRMPKKEGVAKTYGAHCTNLTQMNTIGQQNHQTVWYIRCVGMSQCKISPKSRIKSRITIIMDTLERESN